MPDRECCDCDCHYVGAVEPNNICNSNGKCSVCGNKPGFENRFKDNTLDKAYIARLVDNSFQNIERRAKYKTVAKVGSLVLFFGLLLPAAIYVANRSCQPAHSVGLGLPVDVQTADIPGKILSAIDYNGASGKVNIISYDMRNGRQSWTVNPRIINVQFHADLVDSCVFEFSPSDASISEEIQRVTLYLPDNQMGRGLDEWLDLVKNGPPNTYFVLDPDERIFSVNDEKINLRLNVGLHFNRFTQYPEFYVGGIFVELNNVSVRVNDEVEDATLVTIHASSDRRTIESAEIIVPNQGALSDWQAWLAEKRQEYETVSELSDLNFRFVRASDLYNTIDFSILFPDSKIRVIEFNPDIIDVQVRQDSASYTTLDALHRGRDFYRGWSRATIQVPNEHDKEIWDIFLDQYRSLERPRRVLPSAQAPR